MGLKFIQGGASLEGERVTITPFDPKDADKYQGIYWSEELETQYIILARDGKLFADHAHHGEIALSPVSKDEFRSATWFIPEVTFVRDPAGRITGLKMGGNRVTGIRFEKR
jgi:hypothetical protein